MKLNITFTAEGHKQVTFFDDLISRKVRSFRTFSKLLEALQYETALSKTCGVRIFELLMSVKFDVNFESFFERLVDYTVW